MYRLTWDSPLFPVLIQHLNLGCFVLVCFVSFAGSVRTAYLSLLLLSSPYSLHLSRFCLFKNFHSCTCSGIVEWTAQRHGSSCCQSPDVCSLNLITSASLKPRIHFSETPVSDPMITDWKMLASPSLSSPHFHFTEPALCACLSLYPW